VLAGNGVGLGGRSKASGITGLEEVLAAGPNTSWHLDPSRWLGWLARTRCGVSARTPRHQIFCKNKTIQ